jgi:hypothetical protein
VEALKRASTYHDDVPRDHLPDASQMVTEPPYKSWELRPTREIGKSGRRAKGGRGSGSEWPKVARPRNALVLAYSRGYDRYSLESRVRRNAPARFGKGATEKG